MKASAHVPYCVYVETVSKLTLLSGPVLYCVVPRTNVD